MHSALALSRRSILPIIGLLMAAILALGIAAMIGAMLVAQVNQGMASAVNQSGTLRMQSYRIAAEVADQTTPLSQRIERVGQLAEELEARLASPRLTEAIPSAAGDPLRVAYDAVAERWRQAMRPFLSAEAIEAGGSAYRAGVDAFVEQIHTLVRALEDRAEQRIDWLAWMQASALGLTLAIVLVTLAVVHRRVVRPLDVLLHCADRVRQGDFSARTRLVGEDELGRLASAMDLMTQGLWNIYNELEERVADKTRDLARSNHSLQLLYRSSRALDGAILSDATLREVLVDIQRALKLASVTLCLRDSCCRDSVSECNDAGGRSTGDAVVEPMGVCVSSSQPPGATGLAISAEPSGSPCAICAASSNATDGSSLVVAVADQGRRYGTLRVVCRDGLPLEAWQQPLLDALATQLATALNLQSRLRESRRLVLHEERSILARELHDSLAQSLSYLKIQALRLDAALKALAPEPSRQPGARSRAHSGPVSGPGAEPLPSSPEAILAELRDGISSAYRQLRELLTTFRLKIDGQGLGDAIARTLAEFRARSDLIIELDDHLPGGLLSPNEEVHVLQIVREALSNATRHARARRAQVRLAADAEFVQVEVRDDGCGIASAAQPRGHYGMSIMRERARSLRGELRVDSGPGPGTRVLLRFRSRSRRPASSPAADFYRQATPSAAGEMSNPAAA